MLTGVQGKDLLQMCVLGPFRWIDSVGLVGVAMQGLLADGDSYEDLTFEGVAKDAVRYADALLAELAKGKDSE